MNGLRVGVTGARKAAQLAAAIERRGGIPVVGPLVTSDQPVDDAVILDVTDRILADGADWLAASTGVGMRLWAEVARRHNRYDHLRDLLARTRRVARGAKAVGGLAAFDLQPAHVTDEETDAAVVSWLAGHGRASDRVVVQVHGSDPGNYDVLRDRGLRVTTVQPYVAGRPPEDEERARTLVRAIAAGEVDVVTFTSPGAARQLFLLAQEMGEQIAADVDATIGSSVAVAVIGPVTAEVFRDRDVEIAVMPQRHRQGELIRALERWANRVTPG